MTRIALILSGGASLGTYIAGAVSELLYAFNGNREQGDVTVGVIAGSSAGALTAALAARSLVVNPELIPWIERAWVDGLDAELLLNARRTDTSAVLDASVLERLSRALITADPASDDQPAPALGDSLSVGIALSNLTGLRYELRYGFRNRPDAFFGTRLYDDGMAFELGRGDQAGSPTWEALRQAAVASASFPFALPPQQLERSRSDFPGARLPDTESIRMWYADGGLFAGEPVRLAQRLVRRRGADHEDWRFIFVDPFLRAHGVEPPPRPDRPTSPAEVAGLLIPALLGQGAAKDWIRANRTNERLEVLHSLVECLPEIAEALTDPDALELSRTVGELAEKACELSMGSAARRRPPPGGDVPDRLRAGEGADPVVELLDHHLARIEADDRYAPVLLRAGSRASRSRLAKLIFLIEAASGLENKELMPLYLVAPESSLAGDFLGNFGGLFSRDWREADYRAGRRDARRLIEDELSDIVSYEPAADTAYEVPALDPSFESIPPPQRAALERFVEDEVGRQISAIDFGFLGSLFGFAWKPVLRSWASARAISALRKL